MRTPPFFVSLGIAPTTDAKQIKRAYAVALKRIDQDTEQDAFEALRSAYERALAWAEREAASESESDGEKADGLDETDDVDETDDARDEAPSARGNQPSAYPPDELEPPYFRQGGSAAPPLGVPAAPDSPPPSSTALDRAAERTALDQWASRLMASGASAAPMLQQALADARLSHLESRSRLEAQLADGLYRDPDGRIALFDAAAATFGWNERNARAGGGWAAADWIAQVVNEGLLWDAQPAATQRRQREAVDAVATTDAPTDAQVQAQVPVLKTLQSTFAAWLALRVPADRQDAWTRRWKAPAMDTFDVLPGEAMPARAGPAKKPSPFKRGMKTLGIVLVVLWVVPMIVSIVLRFVPTSPATVPKTTSTPAPEVKPADKPPVLAFEFTGTVDKDSCETAHEFMHESNWLTLDDADANALLVTRAIQCQDKKLWPQADDPLMKCLRAERAAALAAGRTEKSAQCEAAAK